MRKQLVSYFCRRYQRWMTKRQIKEVHKDKCFRVRKGHRKGKPCSLLVKVKV